VTHEPEAIPGWKLAPLTTPADWEICGFLGGPEVAAMSREVV
jgi:hypothetical protein